MDFLKNLSESVRLQDFEIRNNTIILKEYLLPGTFPPCYVMTVALTVLRAMIIC